MLILCFSVTLNGFLPNLVGVFLPFKHCYETRFNLNNPQTALPWICNTELGECVRPRLSQGLVLNYHSLSPSGHLHPPRSHSMPGFYIGMMVIWRMSAPLVDGKLPEGRGPIHFCSLVWLRSITLSSIVAQYINYEWMTPFHSKQIFLQPHLFVDLSFLLVLFCLEPTSPWLVTP